METPIPAEGPMPPIVIGLPEGYERVKITDDPNYEGPPSMNNLGQIVFSKRALINPAGTMEEIYLYDNGKLRRLTNDAVLDRNPSLGQDGTIVWSRYAGGTENGDIVRYSDGEIDNLSNSPQEETSQFALNYDLVMWSTIFGPTNFQLFPFENGEVTQITDDGLDHQSLRVNAPGDFAWRRRVFTGPGLWYSTILYSRDGDILELTDTQEEFSGVALDDLGRVYWKNPSGVFRWVDGVTTLLLPITDPANVSVNTSGDVAFPRWVGEFWTGYLLRDGVLYQLSSDPTQPLTDVKVNGIGDIAIQVGDYPIEDIELIWRIRDPGDFTGDGHVDRFDFESFTNCLSNSECGVDTPPVCFHVFDFDKDADLDFHDFERLQLLISAER